MLAALSSFDGLAYNAIYPNLIPKGCEQKGYTVGAMVYPTVMVVMSPLAAVLYEWVGVAAILLGQCALSLAAALVESRIKMVEHRRLEKGKRFSLRLWAGDLRDAVHFLRRDKGLGAIYAYMAVTNGVATGYSPILVAFFRTAPGMSMAMYSLFSVAEFSGRTWEVPCTIKLRYPPKRRFGFAFLTYQLYEVMDMLLLWLPYPLMLLSRGVCGFLGINSATLREEAVQGYIPDELRAKLNAFFSVLISGASAVFTLIVGALGEILDLRLCISLCGAFSCLACWLTIWRCRRAVDQIYRRTDQAE